MTSAGQRPSADVYWGTGGASLLYTDTRVALLLLNRARRRVIMQVFGVPPDQADLVSVLALALLAKTIHEKTAATLAVPSVPALGDTALVSGVANDVVHWVAGEWSQEMPLLAPLLALVGVATLLRPMARLSLHDVRLAAHRARAGFDHRYGHLVRRSRNRVRGAGRGGVNASPAA